MTEKKPNYRPVYVILALVVITAILVTPMQAFASRGVSFLDTELRTGNDQRTYVATKYPVGDAAKLQAFPTRLDNWTMTNQYDWDFIAQLLNTNVLLARDYRAPGLYIPASLVIIQSTNVSSFHPAPVCYQAQGYTIVDSETATVSVPITNTSWASNGVFGSDGHSFSGNLQAKRLVVEKTLKNGEAQRELNLYFYLKQQQGSVTEKIEWVRISMYIPPTGDYSQHQKVLEDLMAHVVPELFSPAEGSQERTLLGALADHVPGLGERA